ncbi:MAG: 50S ribosomal protein L19 [Candidatus Omnitrophota bacterium]|nr:50S ribosomal protein L19 [Candidatus Omnitrophota bacterium]
MIDKIKLIEGELSAKEMPKFNIGDTIKVLTKIPEGDKVRLHPFEGVVIAKNGSGVRTTFTVRKVSFGEGIERVFPLYSPAIDSIKLVFSGRVKRAKLYYLRGKIGKEAKIKPAVKAAKKA